MNATAGCGSNVGQFTAVSQEGKGAVINECRAMRKSVASRSVSLYFTRAAGSSSGELPTVVIVLSQRSTLMAVGCFRY
jgi:hypothetical protein